MLKDHQTKKLDDYVVDGDTGPGSQPAFSLYFSGQLGYFHLSQALPSYRWLPTKRFQSFKCEDKLGEDELLDNMVHATNFQF